MITPAQCRAARALLDWPRERLASESRIGLRSIVDFERSARAPRYVTLDALRRALEKAGVEFTNSDQPGVKLIKSANGAKEISRQIDALEDKISSMPTPTEPSPEGGMNIMRKAVAKNNLAKLKNRRKHIRSDRSK
jgi:transcriptional regulator with XRE-family HTH domain